MRFNKARLSTGLRIHYAASGDARGTPVVFVHGWPDSWFSFSRVLPLLPATLRLIALDQRGLGESDHPDSGYTIPGFAADLVAVLDALHVRTAVQETVLGLFVRAIDLKVVFEFPFAPQAHVERLRVLGMVIAVALEEAAPVLRQAHRMTAVPGRARGLDQPLFAKVPQIAGPGISRAPIVVSEIATGDHSECTNGRERPGFGAAQGVLAIAVVHELALWSARQVNISAECIRDLAIALSIVAISVGAAGIVIAIGIASVPV